MAAQFQSPSQGIQMRVRNYTSILSQLIYDYQIVVLAQVLVEMADQPEADVRVMIINIQDQQLLNDTNRPVAELLENQLLGFYIRQTEVLPVQLQQHADSKTLVQSEVIFHLSNLHHIIFKGLTTAQQLFEEELCLSSQSSPVSEVPILDLNLLVDNQDATTLGQLFLTNSHNASYLDPVKDWLITHIGKTPVLFHTFQSQTAKGHWVVSTDAVQQYEDAVQKFLQALLVLFFLGSGQQGRQTKFLGL